jgi:hypothetical protein
MIKMPIKLKGFNSSEGQLFSNNIVLVIKLTLQTKTATIATGPKR